MILRIRVNAFIDELREERIQEQMFDEGSRVLLQQAGALADDESLAELRSTIYQARGRSEVDEESSI